MAKTSGARGFVYKEDAAMIFNGPFPLTAYRNGRADAHETEQLDARVHLEERVERHPQEADGNLDDVRDRALADTEPRDAVVSAEREPDVRGVRVGGHLGFSRIVAL